MSIFVISHQYVNDIKRWTPEEHTHTHTKKKKLRQQYSFFYKEINELTTDRKSLEKLLLLQLAHLKRSPAWKKNAPPNSILSPKTCPFYHVKHLSR